MPVGLHLQLDEGQRAVVEDDDLDRQPLLTERDQLANQHRETAVTGEGDDLASGLARLHADRLRQCVGHRPVVEGSDAAAAVRSCAGTAPPRRRACRHRRGRSRRRRRAGRASRSRTGDGSDRDRGSPPARRAACERDGSAPSSARGGSESRPRPALGISATIVSLTVPTSPTSTVDPAADVLAPDVDLDHGHVFGIERPVGKVGAEHQQRVAVLHRAVARCEPQQAGHPDVEGVVVLGNSLPRIVWTTAPLGRPSERDDLVVGARQPAPARIVIRSAAVSDSAAAASASSEGRMTDAAGAITAGGCLAPHVVQEDLAGHHDDGHAAVLDR